MFTKRVTMQSAAAATGNGTAVTVHDVTTLGMQVAGTFVGTVTFEITVNDSDWDSLQVETVASGAVVTAATAPGIFRATVAGLSQVRARVSAWTSGTITVAGFVTGAGGGQGTQPVSVAAYTTPTHTAVNVTTSSGAVLAANANRKYALLINDSDTTIYMKLGAAAVVNQGIRLNANGGSYEMSTLFGNLYTGAIYGIHGGSGNKAILIVEGV